jgi:hypothetical protein
LRAKNKVGYNGKLAGAYYCGKIAKGSCIGPPFESYPRLKQVLSIAGQPSLPGPKGILPTLHCMIKTKSPGMRFPLRRYCIMRFLVLCVGIAQAQAPSNPFQPSIPENKSYTEIYTITALCDDRTYLQVLLTITNLGIGDKNATAKILVLHPLNPPFKANMYYDHSKWSCAGIPDPYLSIGSCKIVQKHKKVDLVASLDSGKVHLVLAGTPSPINPPNTGFCVDNQKPFGAATGGKYYEYEILIPWTQAEATITLPGKASRSLQGHGMLEHSRSVGNPKEISQGWVTFRGYRNDSFFVANFRLPPESGLPIAGWILNQGCGVPVALNGLRFKTAGATSNCKLHDVCDISARDNSFCINKGVLFCRDSFIDELGSFLGAIVKLVVGDLVTNYYNADVRFPGRKQTMSGVLELMTLE